MKIKKVEVELKCSEDGIWLCINSKSGKHAMLHVDNCFSSSGLANQCIREWAREQFIEGGDENN